ncbi:MAG: permease-like cell division protein FtsX [Bacteroidales bacterium]|jgi:cell division transport system permease protein|nr:permease-like cell division protein FtsX [Bacteroidales bacterium]MDD2203775.1 permease-like cell division protein FtsX [Bacteroidales bacterium]MDD3151591.1 permease-like cell division protein FtsX [Bacteroidales bacterium]MDD3913286.1 permease-like cell division protein FtsX [Bacteroidales bacterium]MDD4633317.1 permease-like cell division protein FtsX [Bacteroidales bacterium]
MNQEEKFNKRRLRSSYANVIFSVSLMLYLCGLLLLFVFNTNFIIDNLRENIGITVVLDDDVDDVDVRFFLKKLYLKPFTKEITYTSKDEAAAELAQDLGENFIEFIGFNPLPSSFELKVYSDYSNNDSLKVIYDVLKTNKCVSSVSAQYDMIDNLNKTKVRLSIILIALNVLLLFIIIVVINNAIKLSIYANRQQIKTMQMIGATAAFIRRPYLLKGLIQGVIGATISAILLSLTICVIVMYYPDIQILLSPIQFVLVFGFVYVFGVLIAFLTTYPAVNKYLNVKMKILY